MVYLLEAGLLLMQEYVGCVDVLATMQLSMIVAPVSCFLSKMSCYKIAWR